MSAVVSTGSAHRHEDDDEDADGEGDREGVRAQEPGLDRASPPLARIVPEPISSSERSITGSSTFRRSAFASAAAGR